MGQRLPQQQQQPGHQQLREQLPQCWLVSQLQDASSKATMQEKLQKKLQKKLGLLLVISLPLVWQALEWRWQQGEELGWLLVMQTLWVTGP